LTAAQIQEAIRFNRVRLTDQYSIRTLRDVLGLDPVPATIDEPFVRAVLRWQANRRMGQDGKVGHRTTRSFFLELVAERAFRDAVLLLMDSYALPPARQLHAVRIGGGPFCAYPQGDHRTATVFGGHCPPTGGPVTMGVCRARIPRTRAGYNHFIRIIGHELLHVPDCAAASAPNLAAGEFDAFAWEVCAGGRAPRLTPRWRVRHAGHALGYFGRIPAHLRTAARIRMRHRLVNLILVRGVGPC
jgi:hypothetical protein